MTLTTGSFLGRLIGHAVQGKPLDIIEDLRQSAVEESEAKEKKENDRDVIDTSGEESK